MTLLSESTDTWKNSVLTIKKKVCLNRNHSEQLIDVFRYPFRNDKKKRAKYIDKEHVAVRSTLKLSVNLVCSASTGTIPDANAMEYEQDAIPRLQYLMEKQPLCVEFENQFNYWTE